MGFWETAFNVGSQVVQSTKNQIERNATQLKNDVERESRYTRSKSDSELRAQYKNENNSIAKRYAAQQELKNRGYGNKK